MPKKAEVLSNIPLPNITEHKQAEEELKHSGEFFEIIFNSTHDVISIINTYDFRIAKVNKAFLEKHGLKEEEVIGKTCYKITHHRSDPCTAPDDTCPLLDTITTGELSVAEHVHYAKDGAKIYVEVSTSPIKDENERVIQVIHATKDITEHKQAEELYKTLASSSPVGVYIVQDRRFVFINPQFQKYLGFTEDELLDTNPLELVHPEDREMVRESAVEMLKGKRLSPYEFRDISKSGEVIWAMETVTSVHYKGRQAALGNFMDITERKQAEEALRKSEEHFRSVTESASDAIISTDSHGNIIYWNNAAETVFGYSDDKAIGKPLTVLMPERFRQAHQEALNRVVSGGSPNIIGKTAEVVGLRKDGSEFPLELSLSSWRTQEGIFFTGIARDITERKQAEEEKSKLLHQVQERVKELRCLYGIDTIANRKNVTPEKIFQYTVNLVPPSWQYPEVTCSRIIFEGKEYKTENFKKTKWCQSADIVIDSKKVGIIEVGYSEKKPDEYEGPFFKEERDLINSIAQRLAGITERKRAEEALQESEERYRALINLGGSIGEAIVMLQDKDGVDATHIFVSDEWPRITGYSKKELLGISFFDLLHPRHREASLKRHKRKISGEAVPELFEMSLIRKDGTEVPIELTSAYTTYKGERANVAFIRDITERKRMEQELQKKNKQLDAQNEELQLRGEELMAQQQELIEKSHEVEEASQAKSAFLATMSHELRTPLNAVIGFSQLLLDGIPGKVSKGQGQCLNDILSSGEHLLNLINDVLDLSKVEAGKIELKLASLNLADVIDSVVQTVKPMLADNRHLLEFSIEEGLPQVRADEGRLRQILLNLMSNAIKFTPPSGKLGIEAGRDGDWCRVNIVDNGIGIKKEDQKRIFEPFTQADSLPKKRREGTGLGLALTKQLVEMCGGKIWVESKYRRGSKFTFTLPLATAA